jgi:hypothetical protein
MATVASLNIQGNGSPAFTKVEGGVLNNTGPLSSPPVGRVVKFDPEKHMNFSPPSKFYTLNELGLSPEGAISPVAITEPFPLFTPEGIEEIRADLFRREMLEKHMYKEPKHPGVYKLRGYGPDAPFVHSAWRSEAMLKACSEAAGCELEVVFEYEIGHINVQLPPGALESGKSMEECLPPASPPKQSSKDLKQDEEVRGEPMDESIITAWHNDSYPWVCVCMLSDPKGMRGGETALRKGDGSIFKVRGPDIGSAVMMQGGVINHVALQSLGSGERITMVTSFRPKDPLVWDGCNLGNVKRVSDHARLFSQWTTYRTEVISKRATAFAESLKNNVMTAEEIKAATEAWTKRQVEYLLFTANEMTERGHKGNYNY